MTQIIIDRIKVFRANTGSKTRAFSGPLAQILKGSIRSHDDQMNWQWVSFQKPQKNGCIQQPSSSFDTWHDYQFTTGNSGKMFWPWFLSRPRFAIPLFLTHVS